VVDHEIYRSRKSIEGKKPIDLGIIHPIIVIYNEYFHRSSDT